MPLSKNDLSALARTSASLTKKSSEKNGSRVGSARTRTTCLVMRLTTTSHRNASTRPRHAQPICSLRVSWNERKTGYEARADADAASLGAGADGDDDDDDAVAGRSGRGLGEE